MCTVHRLSHISLRLALLVLIAVPLSVQAGSAGGGARPAFIENKGQLRDMSHQPVPFVLYRLETNNVKVYVTEQGLTYVYTRLEKKRSADRSDRHRLRSTISGSPSKPERTLHMAWASMHLEGATIDRSRIIPEEQHPERYDFYPNDVPEGVLDVHAYGKLTIPDVYPGIDWVLYGSTDGGFKYDFVVHAGADPSRIHLLFDADGPVALLPDGGLRIHTEEGSFSESAPLSYHAEDGSPIPNAFVVKVLDAHRCSVRFELKDINVARTQVIDPQLTWNTLTAGDMLDGPFSLCTNSNGDVITTGYDGAGSGFPLGVATGNYSGAYAVGGLGGLMGCYLRAFNSNGVLLWSTLYESAFFGQVIVDANDRIIAVGNGASDFSTQPGTGSFSGAYFQGTSASAELNDMCIVGFTPGGVREWATFLGGTHARTVTTDAAGNFIIAGNTLASDLITQAGTGAFTGAYLQAAPVGAEEMGLLAFSPNGVKLWSTYFGGVGDDVAGHITRRTDGRFFIAGNTGSNNLPTLATGAMSGAYVDATYGGQLDGLLLGLAPNGALEWCSYFGGSHEDAIIGLDTDTPGRILIAGMTMSTNFPIQPGIGSFTGAYFDDVMENQDAFIAGFNASGAKEWTTYFGGWQTEGGGPAFNPTFLSTEQLNVDKCGNILVAINTMSPNMPIVSPGCNSSIDPILDDNLSWEDVFLMRFTTNGALNWSTYIGGSGGEFRPPFTIDPVSNAIFLSAESYDQEGFNDFPYVDAGGGAYFDDTYPVPLGDDAFIMKFVPTACYACNVLTLGVQTEILQCHGDCNGTATISATQGAAPFTYAWNNGASTASATGLCAGTYTVEVTDADGLTATIGFDIQEPEAIVTTTNTTGSSCTGATGSATVEVTGGDMSFYSVLWSNAQTTPTAAGLAVGTYTVQVTDTTGCSVTDSVVVSGLSSPVASAQVTTNPITAGESTQLVGLGGVSFIWSPTVGLNCTTCATPVASPNDTTTYCVVVTDVNNCSDTACVRVDVLRPCTVFVPNAFSPNASSKNDTQCVYGDCIKFMLFTIYDRWGNKVFETSDQKTCWDGLHNGQPLNAGVFVYHLSATLSNGETVEKQGNITLVR